MGRAAGAPARPPARRGARRSAGAAAGRRPSRRGVPAPGQADGRHGGEDQTVRVGGEERRESGRPSPFDQLPPRVAARAVHRLVVRRPEPLEGGVRHEQEPPGAQDAMTLPEGAGLRGHVPVIQEVEAEAGRERLTAKRQRLGAPAGEPREPAPPGELERGRVGVDAEPRALRGQDSPTSRPPRTRRRGPARPAPRSDAGASGPGVRFELEPPVRVLELEVLGEGLGFHRLRRRARRRPGSGSRGTGR